MVYSYIAHIHISTRPIRFTVWNIEHIECIYSFHITHQYNHTNQFTLWGGRDFTSLELIGWDSNPCSQSFVTSALDHHATTIWIINQLTSISYDHPGQALIVIIVACIYGTRLGAYLSQIPIDVFRQYYKGQHWDSYPAPYHHWSNNLYHLFSHSLSLNSSSDRLICQFGELKELLSIS